MSVSEKTVAIITTLRPEQTEMDIQNAFHREFFNVIISKSEKKTLFQQIYLIDKMNLMDNVITVGSLTNKHKKDIAKRANELFDMVNIPIAARKKLPLLISGGEAQRVGIVRAAINAPVAIFADEPTGALNSSNSDAVLDVFSKLNTTGQGIIMVTHDKKSALRGNRVVYLKDGKIFGDCNFGTYSADDQDRVKKLEDFLAKMGW